MFEYGSVEKRQEAVKHAIELLRTILSLTREAYQNGEMADMWTSAAQLQALDAQLQNLGATASLPQSKEYATKQLTAMLEEYKDLPEDVLNRLRTQIFDLYPDTPEREM